MLQQQLHSITALTMSFMVNNFYKKKPYYYFPDYCDFRIRNDADTVNLQQIGLHLPACVHWHGEEDKRNRTNNNVDHIVDNGTR